MNPPDDDLDIVYLPDMEGFADPDSTGNGDDEGGELDEHTLAFVRKIELENKSRSNINPTGFMSTRQKAQHGKYLIKQAIVELLESERGEWLSRSRIEDALCISSEYKGSGDSPSFDGGFSAMLLSELAEEEKIKRNKTGKGWLYSIPK